MESFYTFQATKKRDGKEFRFSSKEDLLKKIQSYLSNNGLDLHDFKEIDDGLFYNPEEGVFIQSDYWYWDGEHYHVDGFNILWN